MRPSEKILRQLGFAFIHEQAGITEYRLLNNGLKVILAPDTASRVVAVVQHINVGSRHEGAGNTGYSHLLEHDLFKGTPTHHPSLGNSYKQFMARLGGVSNASTSFDRTNYYGKIPGTHLPEYLEHEADRLRNIIISDVDLQTEMPVVIDEFDQGENLADRVMTKQLFATAFTEHPYKVPTIGARSEVMKVTAASLRERLYDVYYYPNNTALIVVGGFDPATALKEIAAKYGHIAPSPKPIPTPYTVEPKQFGERRFLIRKPGDLPQVLMGFHIPEAEHDDTHALHALNVILGGTPSSRLHRRLVNTGLASKSGAGCFTLHDPGLMTVRTKLTADATPEAVEKIMLEEVERLANDLVLPEELELAKTLNRTGRPLLKTDKLDYAESLSEHESHASWRWGEEYDANFELVTRERIREVAQRYLVADNRSVGHFYPTKPAAAKSGASVAEENTAAPITQPASATAAGVGSPTDSSPVSSGSSDQSSAGAASYASQLHKTVLANGMKVLLLPTQAEGAFGLALTIDAGAAYAPSDRAVVAGMVASLLSKGSAKYSKEQIAAHMTGMNVDYGFRYSTFTSMFETHILPDALPQFLDILADGIRNPLFDEQEVELSKVMARTGLKSASEDPESAAILALKRGLYPAGSPYRSHPFPELLAQVDKVTLGDLKSFHQAYYVPKGMILTIVGKFDAAEMLKLVEDKFGSWTGTDPRQITVPFYPEREKAERINIQIDGKDNLTVLFGLAANLQRTNPDHFPAMLANNALGGGFLGSRLFIEVRDKRGLTYGVYSNFMENIKSGAPWLIQLTTNGDKVEEAIAVVKSVVAEYVKNGITEAELAKEKEQLFNSTQMQLDTPVAVASTINGLELRGVGAGVLDKLKDSLDAVTKQEVDAVIRKYFDIDRGLIVVAGNLPKGTKATN